MGQIRHHAFAQRALTRLALVALLAAAVVPSSSVAATATSDPVSLSIEVARWNALHRFGLVWQAIDPRDQRVTTFGFWEACKRKSAPEGLKLKSLKGTSRPATVVLPPLGKTAVTVVTLEARYTLPTLSGVGTATSTFYWTRSGGRWNALWSASDYRAYSHQRCPAP